MLPKRLKLRNKLLLYRLRNFHRAAIDPAAIDPALEPRLNQIFAPLKSIVADNAFRTSSRPSGGISRRTDCGPGALSSKRSCSRSFAICSIAWGTRFRSRRSRRCLWNGYGDQYRLQDHSSLDWRAPASQAPSADPEGPQHVCHSSVGASGIWMFCSASSAWNMSAKTDRKQWSVAID